MKIRTGEDEQLPELFWLSDMHWTRIQPLLPVCKRGFRHVDDRRIISAVIHVLKTGTPWSQTPKEYGSVRPLYNRFRRWVEIGIWEEIFGALADPELPDRGRPHKFARHLVHLRCICHAFL